MKLLVAGDIHGSSNAIDLIKEQHKRFSPDVTVICGDITNFGTKEEAKDMIDSIPGKVVAVPGNCDPPGVEQGVEMSHGIDLHIKKYRWRNFTFSGVGGGLKMFGTPREYGEDTYREKMKKILPTDILVLHGPPYGKNDLIGGKHKGSKEILRAVGSYPPLLVLSGHIHECYGVLREGRTFFINPGASKDGRTAILEIDDENKNVLESSIKLMD